MRRLALIGAIGLLLVSAVPTFAASSNSVWRATLSGGTIHGSATLAERADGKAASVAVKLHDVKPGTKITVTLYAGMNGTGPVIATRLTFKAPAAGPATHRFWLTKAELATLKADIAAKDAFSVTVVSTPATGAPTMLTGNLIAVVR